MQAVLDYNKRHSYSNRQEPAATNLASSIPSIKDVVSIKKQSNIEIEHALLTGKE